MLLAEHQVVFFFTIRDCKRSFRRKVVDFREHRNNCFVNEFRKVLPRAGGPMAGFCPSLRSRLRAAPVLPRWLPWHSIARERAPGAPPGSRSAANGDLLRSPACGAGGGSPTAPRCSLPSPLLVPSEIKECRQICTAHRFASSSRAVRLFLLAADS